MSEPISVTYERVDDLPLLLAQQKRMGVQLIYYMKVNEKSKKKI